MDLINILTLLKTPGIGRRSVRYILDSIQANPATTEDLLAVIKNAHNTNKRIKIPALDDLHTAQNVAQRIIKTAESSNIKIISIEDDLFPRRLKFIPDPPVLLYVKGNTDVLNKPLAVAIIGTREPTDYGKKAGRDLSRLFAQNGFVVVSGLAIGCDTAAHTGCLDASGLSIAVLPSGVDNVYPTQNKSLADDILLKGGCLISEYEMNTEPRSSNFVERDRLQSGLSQAVIVIETGVQGGSMHTVDFARQQQRIVACINSHPVQYQSHQKVQGNTKLVSDGATRLENEKDINGLIALLKMPEQQEVAKQNESKRSAKKDVIQGELFN